MPPRISSKLTYANVTATLALFVALGGSSWAAITITGKNVRNGSLTGKDIKRNSIGARQVNETRLGPVRKALNLGVDARRGLQVACPGGTLPAAGGCVEARPRPAAGYDSAVLACSGFDATPRVGGDLAHERRLPTHAELRALFTRDIAPAPGGELTGHIYPAGDANGNVTALTVVSKTGRVALAPDDGNNPRAFRCAVDPYN